MMPWRKKLHQTLNGLRKEHPDLRIAILGVGHELRCDDALGLFAVRRLLQRFDSHPDLLLLETGPAPESFFGKIIQFQPHLTLVIDAAQIDLPPGSIAWIETHQVAGELTNTHGLPLNLMLDYLAFETGCQTAILGIQPADLSFGENITPEVDRAIRSIVNEFSTSLVSTELHKGAFET